MIIVIEKTKSFWQKLKPLLRLDINMIIKSLNTATSTAAPIKTSHAESTTLQVSAPADHLRWLCLNLMFDIAKYKWQGNEGEKFFLVYFSSLQMRYFWKKCQCETSGLFVYQCIWVCVVHDLVYLVGGFLIGVEVSFPKAISACAVSAFTSKIWSLLHSQDIELSFVWKN